MRPDDLGSSMTLLAVIPSLPRATLARLTEAMIDRMDVLDGDSDVEANGDELDGSMGEDEFLDRDDGLGLPGVPEDTEDDDPAGDALDAGELDEARGLGKPIYPLDQTLGPLNERQVQRDDQQALLAR